MQLAKEIKTFAGCVQTCIDISKKENKKIYLSMGIDSGNWARMISGKANFPAGRVNEFCDMVGHDLLLYWLCLEGGYEPRVLPKFLEDQIEEKNEIIKEQEERIASLAEKLCWFEKTIEALGGTLREKNTKNEG